MFLAASFATILSMASQLLELHLKWSVSLSTLCKAGVARIRKGKGHFFGVLAS